jgi:Predicted membrane protein (DUF2232)
MPVSVPARERPDPRTGGVLSAAVASTLVFSAVVIPFVGVVVAIVSPLPLILLRIRGSFGAALLATLLAAGTIGAIFTPGLAIGYLAFLAAPGLLMGEAMARGRGLRKGCAWALMLLSLEIGAVLIAEGPELSAGMLAWIDDARSPKALADLRTRGLSDDLIEDFAQQSLWVRNVLAVVYPAAFLIWGGLVVLSNAMLLGGYLARRDPGWLDGGEFEDIRWGLGLAVVFVAAGAAVLAPPLRPAAYNVLLVLAFFYALQGLAVVAYYARRLAAPPFLRIAVMVLVLINPWAPQILGLLGLFDTWFDFRKWAQPPEAPKR